MLILHCWSSSGRDCLDSFGMDSEVLRIGSRNYQIPCQENRMVVAVPVR